MYSLFSEALASKACVMLVDDVYVTYIQFGFPIYVMYEFLIFMISATKRLMA